VAAIVACTTRSPGDDGRGPNPRLSFGTGSHSCLDRPLARTEPRTVLAELLRELPALGPAVPVEERRQTQGLTVGGLREVPVRR